MKRSFLAVIVALCSCSIVVNTTVPNVVNKQNLVNCERDVQCPNPRHVVVSCNNSGMPICRYVCHLGEPLVPAGRAKPSKCGSVCPSGYHVATLNPITHGMGESCFVHTKCPSDKSVILPGSSWHDTICGYPDDYKPPSTLTEPSVSTPLVEKLNWLTMLWIRAIPEEDIAKICDSLFTHPESDLCRKVPIYHMFGDRQKTAENVYYALNIISAFETAAKMYEDVVKPFLPSALDPAKVQIQFLHDNPLFVDVSKNNSLTVQARVTIPLGATNKFIPRAFNWKDRRNGLGGTSVLSASRSLIVPRDHRFNTTKGLQWAKSYGDGFFCSYVGHFVDCKAFRFSFIQNSGSETFVLHRIT